MENFGYVLATKMLVDNKRKVRFMYREEVTNPQDSGWRFFCGDEDDEYVNNPDHIAIYNINTILGIDKSILPYLNSAVGAAYERLDETTTFRMAEDFGFGEEGK